MSLSKKNKIKRKLSIFHVHIGIFYGSPTFSFKVDRFSTLNPVWAVKITYFKYCIKGWERSSNNT